MKRIIEILSRFRKDKSGIAAVEFALLAPFFMFGVMGLTDVGFYAYEKMKLTSGVRSAAQYVLVGGKDDAVMKSLISDGSGFSADEMVVDVTEYCDCAVDDAAAECFSECSDGGATRIYRLISVKLTSTSTIFSDAYVQSSAEVRVR